MKNPLPFILLCAACFHAGVAGAATVQIWEEVPYLRIQDSPFYAGIVAGTIVLEDFEDQQLNTPLVTSWDYPRVIGTGPLGDQLSRQQGSSFRGLGNSMNVFSVDADDGINGDFLGLLGNTWTSIDLATGQLYGRMEFRFQRDAEGRLPTFVGFVVTDVLSPDSNVEIGAWDAVPGNNWWSDNTYDARTWRPFDHFGDTRSHRFFGIYSDTGIERLVIENAKQIDHLQYGYAIPEPTPFFLMAALVCGAGLKRRRERFREVVSDGFRTQVQGPVVFFAIALLQIQTAWAGDVRVAGILDYQTGAHTLDWLHFQVSSPGIVDVSATVRGPNLRRGWLVLGRFNETDSRLSEVSLLPPEAEEVAAYSGQFTLPPGRWAIGFVAATTAPILSVYLSPSAPPFLNFGTGAPDGNYNMRVTGDVEGLEYWEGQWSNDFKVTYLKEPLLEIASFRRINDGVWSIGWRASAGRRYVVQTSPDLSAWVDLMGVITLSNGFASTSVSSQLSDLQRYFRVRRLE